MSSMLSLCSGAAALWSHSEMREVVHQWRWGGGCSHDTWTRSGSGSGAGAPEISAAAAAAAAAAASSTSTAWQHMDACKGHQCNHVFVAGALLRLHGRDACLN